MVSKKTGKKKKKVNKAGSSVAKPKGGAKEKKDIKSPSEAATYLEQWEQELSTWKFNKNTQSWLIRHMYEVDKVSKSSFATLLKYLEGLKGDSARLRIRSEASRRAIRYKEHQEKGSEEATEAEPADIDTKDTESTKMEEVDEEERWKRLSEHDKRKEYKRARKILESVLAK